MSEINVAEEIDRVRTSCINVVNERANSLIKDCNEDSDVATFVHYVLGKFNYDSIDYYKQHVARDIIYKLGYSIDDNCYHSTDTTYNLSQFIGNYFYDDSYAIVEFDDEQKTLIVKDDPIYGHQDVAKYLEVIDKVAAYNMQIEKLFNSADFNNPILEQYFHNHTIQSAIESTKARINNVSTLQSSKAEEIIKWCKENHDVATFVDYAFDRFEILEYHSYGVRKLMKKLGYNVDDDSITPVIDMYDFLNNHIYGKDKLIVKFDFTTGDFIIDTNCVSDDVVDIKMYLKAASDCSKYNRGITHD